MPISKENLEKYISPKFDWNVDTCGCQPNYYDDYCKALELLKKSNIYVTDNELKAEINEFVDRN